LIGRKEKAAAPDACMSFFKKKGQRPNVNEQKPWKNGQTIRSLSEFIRPKKRLQSRGGTQELAERKSCTGN